MSPLPAVLDGTAENELWFTPTKHRLVMLFDVVWIGGDQVGIAIAIYAADIDSCIFLEIGDLDGPKEFIFHSWAPTQ